MAFKKLLFIILLLFMVFVLSEQCQSQAEPPNGHVRVKNFGGYITKFTVTYVLGGQNQIIRSDYFSYNEVREFEINKYARNVYVTIQNLVFFGNWKTIYENSIGASDQFCIDLTGTTFTPTYKFCTI